MRISVVDWITAVLKICENSTNFDEKEVQLIFQDFKNQYERFSDQQKLDMMGILTKELSKTDLLFVLSFFVRYFGNECLPLAIECSEQVAKDIVYRSMLEVQLLSCSSQCYLDMRAFHDRTVAEWTEKIFVKGGSSPVSNRNKKRIVIITEQLLSDLHAPTKVVLDRAYVLQHYMNYEVLLVVMPSNAGSVGDVWYQSFSYAANPEYNNKPIARSYKDEMFFGFQVGMEQGNTRDYALLFAYVLEWNPLFIFNIGVRNPVADVFTKYTTVVARNTSKVLPVSEAKILIDLGHNEELVSKLSQKVLRFGELPIYFGEEKRKHCRSMYGLDDTQFLCVVVGHRLNKEVDNEFICMIEKLIKKNKAIVFVFIGNIGSKKDIISERISPKNLCFIDYCDDLIGIYKIMDLYINPRRMGGGYSAQMALGAELPVVTTDYGDVAGYARLLGEDNQVVSSYGQIESEILRCSKDIEYYKKRKKQVHLIANEMTEENSYRELGNALQIIINQVVQE